MKLGLRDHVPQPTDVQLSSVWSPAADSALPAAGGVRGLNWGMLGNDQYGDCYWASAAHEVMAEAHLAGRSPSFDTESVLASYADYLGVSPTQLEQHDQGTDAREGARFRREHGVFDVGRKGHHIGAYAFENDPAKLPALISALEGCTVCVELTAACEQEFNVAEQEDRDFEWDAACLRSNVVGGHAISGVFYDERGIGVVSWGREGIIAPEYLDRFMQTTVVYFSGSTLKGGHTPQGLDRAKLLQIVNEVRGA